MQSTVESTTKPWMAIGDYNDISSYDEVRSFANYTSAGQRRKFSENINKCNLINMGFSRSKFTWNNGRQGTANVSKRLDRGLCNEEWRATFLEGIIQTLPCTYSDHSPLIVHIMGKNQLLPPPNKPYHFEAA